MLRTLRRLLKPAEPVDQVIRKAIPEIDDETVGIVATVRPYTMTSVERLWAMAQAVRHVAATGVTGDIVECGVWKGGNLLLAGMLSERLGLDRTIWGYDTYAGMSEPTDRDVSLSGASAWGKYRESERAGHNDWCYAPLADVHRVIETHSSYRNYRFVVGKCEETLKDPANLPDRIAILRLDTDWYESTRAEIETLYPRLQPGGILIVDDYGHWSGARQAIDEYFRDRPILLLRIDYTGRIHLKT
jgi:O-methyltransferase